MRPLPAILAVATLATLASLSPLGGSLSAQSAVGRWDLTAEEGDQRWPMWLEITGAAPPAGRLQGRYDHALALTGLEVDGPRVMFPMPAETPQANAPTFGAVVTGDDLLGEIIHPDGRRITVRGKRAPRLNRPVPEWGREVDLLADGLAGWTVRGSRNGWKVEAGELVNTPPSSDLISKARFTDFRLRLEVNVPPAGNSGIYLRGRHEVQVQDDYGKPPHNRGMGGIYGQVAPTTQPARPAGEWQQYEITFVGRRVTVVLNGVTMVDNVEIPGITGGALDSAEGDPGPIMLQGDHSGVRYRNIRITLPREP